MTPSLIELAYLIASVLFILGLRALRAPESARKGIVLAAVGMLVAIGATLLHNDIVSYRWIVAGAVIGAAIGTAMAVLIPMTKMPERIALSHSFGGLAAALVGISEYYRHSDVLIPGKMAAIGFEVMLGSLTFTGSLMAFGKLQGIIAERPLTHAFQNGLNVTLLFTTLALIGYLIFDASSSSLFYLVVGLSFLLGVLFVLPIGGADMPVVISLLNSYAGLAAAATGFALSNSVLIVCGALDGASGFFLSIVMSKAMNRSFTNIIFGAFGSESKASARAIATDKSVKSATLEDALIVLRNASSVIIIPGYGMAASHAQHAVRELGELLERRGVTVKYAIHPVAGRMPGHMNVLLAEANVSYDHLYDIDAINDEFPATDVALVVGANDVVNPAAKRDSKSPIYGMPVLNAELARSVLVLKRSMNPGFAKIENELFLRSNTMMLFGDARTTLSELVRGLKES
ncbi:MAG TPA: NAD(P)(+) transhydrogenase (Re/Si-specific) subunit beta [Candidatus Binatia bacterium]|nr:NAD(P)(+) transhydrogenase (Re/Si-specific) subunit beta [Candidatus Binatia bacterium]